jgi:hypothetical protein
VSGRGVKLNVCVCLVTWQQLYVASVYMKVGITVCGLCWKGVFCRQLLCLFYETVLPELSQLIASSFSEIVNLECPSRTSMCKAYQWEP